MSKKFITVPDSPKLPFSPAIKAGDFIFVSGQTGFADPKTGKEIIGFLRKMNTNMGTTIIIVTHDYEVAKLADRIIRLRDGKVVEEEIIKGALARK